MSPRLEFDPRLTAMRSAKRSWLRRLRWSLTILAGLLLLGAASTFTAVDQTLAPRPGGQPQVSKSQSTNFRAGFGRATLTPKVGAVVDRPEAGEFRSVPLAGYGDRHGQPATGVHDEVWVKAVAFAAGGSTGVVVSADALIIPREVAESTAANLAGTHGLRRDQICFSATHTHCSLGGWGQRFVGEAFAGPFNPGIRTWFAQQLAAAATNALGDLQSASLGAGRFDATNWVRNRLVGDRGQVDPGFSLLYAKQADGDTAVIGSYSAHATVLGSKVMQFSADYPGVWQRTLEGAGIKLAVFVAGGVGSHGPRVSPGGFEGTEVMGRALAEETLRQLPRITLHESVPFEASVAVLELPELQVRVTDSIRLRPWATRQLMPPLASATLLQAFRFGSVVWLSTPCDYSGELALEVKAAARSMGRQAVVTSFNGDYVGYVIPAKYYHLDGYEPRVMNFYGPRVAEVFTDTLLQLAAPADPPSAASPPTQ